MNNSYSTHPVIQLAKQSALKSYASLVRKMAQTCDREIEKELSVFSPTTDYPGLNAARIFLRKAGDEMLEKLNAQYRVLLDQAIDALSPKAQNGISGLTADNLTLVDDQIILRQIEVGHLATKLGSTCSDSLGKVNITIAQILDRPEAKQKDNPFRPELIAFSLTEVLYAMVEHENVRRFLLSNAISALAQYLPEYYVDLCAVFEAGGISPKLIARPTVAPASTISNVPQTVQGATVPDNTISAAANRASVPPTTQSAIEQLMQMLQRQMADNTTNAVPGSAATSAIGRNNPLVGFQELVNLARGSNSSAPHQPTAQLLAKIEDFQRMAAQGQAASAQVSANGNQLYSLGAQLGDNAATVSERLSMDMVAVLFDLILNDPKIPEPLRSKIGGLQIPVLKSSIVDPGTLQQVDHPTRQLLNHMGMVSVGVPPESNLGQSVESELGRISQSILNNFKNDTGIFVQHLEQLKQFMNDQMRECDLINQRNIEAMEEFQRYSYVTQSITSTVRETLAPMKIDQRVIDFCMNIWVNVLVRAAVKINKALNNSADSTVARLKLFFNALPDLIWSAQTKSSTQDRLTLIRVLPKLVKILNSGMKGLQIPENDAKHAMDQLLAVHAVVLANTDDNSNNKLPSREELRQMFSFEAILEDPSMSKAIAPPPLDEALIRASLEKRGLDAQVTITNEKGYASTIETEWIEAMEVGTRIEYKVDGNYQHGRLIWVDTHRTLFMFRLDQQPKTLIFCAVSLSRALRDRDLAFVESAPVFERAIELLLQQMATLAQ